jgi:division protein CdvB (Snf7/Vps24/ESCRT-III family)
VFTAPRHWEVKMTDKSADANAVANRRGFLRSLGASAAGATAAVVGVTAAAPSAEAAENAAERVKKRYRETDHVKAYYRTNRY